MRLSPENITLEMSTCLFSCVYPLSTCEDRSCHIQRQMDASHGQFERHQCRKLLKDLMKLKSSLAKLLQTSTNGFAGAEGECQGHSADADQRWLQCIEPPPSWRRTCMVCIMPKHDLLPFLKTFPPTDSNIWQQRSTLPQLVCGSKCTSISPTLSSGRI